jgi:hypothetical protein
VVIDGVVTGYQSADSTLQAVGAALAGPAGGDVHDETVEA